MPLAAPDSLQAALSRPVAILGGGISGEGVRDLLAALKVEGRIYDADASKGAAFTEAAAKLHGLAVFSPGFPPGHPWLSRAAASGAVCSAELDFAAQFWRGRLVTVTGTNGKTTVTEFLTHALNASGREAYATGNIGHPFSRLVAEMRGGPTDVFAICEVSSFQAEALSALRADATLWTNFAEDHLERHPGLESYFAAKWKLVAHTRPGAVLAGSSVARFARKYDRPIAALMEVPTENQPAAPQLARTPFAEYPQRENFLLARAWWQAAGFDDAALIAAAKTFKLGRHRLACVGVHDGVTFWNDSKATNFHAVEAALAGFTEPVVLIAGGRSKGGDLAGFVHRIASRVKHVVLIGETRGELAFHCAAFRVANTSCADFGEAVRRAAELAGSGEHVLLSPGFASFDMFRNYEDRGQQFEALVQKVGQENGAPAASLG